MKKEPKAFFDYSQTIDDVNENLEDYNWITFDDMIADMEANKKITKPYSHWIVHKGKETFHFFISKVNFAFY